MEKFKSKKSTHEISFSVFDVLYYKGKKVTQLTLLQRKELLDKIIPHNMPLLNKIQWMRGNGIAYFELVKNMGLEGIVLSIYITMNKILMYIIRKIYTYKHKVIHINTEES